MATRLYRSFLHLTRTLHTYVTMFALILLIFFSFTGFIMNHSALFGIDEFVVSDKTAATPMPPDIAADKSPDHDMKVEVFLRARLGAHGERTAFDDQEDTTRVQFTGPGHKMEFTITKADGKIDAHTETHNTLGLLSDLHKGSGSGNAWRLFIDATAIFLLFSCVSGVILWISLPKRRTLGIIALAASILLCTACYLLLVP